MTATDKINIGILGTGFGQTHARIFSSFPDVEVTGIFGRDEQKTQDVAAELGIQGYTDPQALIAHPDVDALVICLPTKLHAQYVLTALDHDKHVFCEIPIAYKLSDANQMARAAAEKGKQLLVALYVRFVSDYKYIQEQIGEGVLGELKAVYANRRTPPIWGNGWDENFILNLMLHDIDYVAWLLGKPVAVTSRGLDNPTRGWNHVSMALEYPDCNVVIEGCGMMPASFPFSTSLRVVGTAGAIDLDWHWGGTAPVSAVRHYPNAGEPQNLSIPGYDPYQAECRYFVDCLQGKADPKLLSIDTALESLEIALHSKASLEQGGKRISL